MDAEQVGVELVVLDLTEEAEARAHHQFEDLAVEPEVAAKTAKSGVEAQVQACLQVEAKVEAIAGAEVEAAEVTKRKGRKERANVDLNLCFNSSDN